MLERPIRQVALLASLAPWAACQRPQAQRATGNLPDAQGAWSQGAASARSLDTLARDSAVRALLRQHPTTRLAFDSDNRNPWLDTLQKTDPTYHPYRAAGDLNGDGRVDLVVALYDSSSATNQRFLLYYLPATEHALGPPQLLAATGWLANAGLFVDHGELSAGEFYSDVFVTFHWDSLTRRLMLTPCDSVGPFRCLR